MGPTKVVITGPEGSGKTSFVRTIADMTVATTEPHPSGEGHVTIDFGRISLAQDLTIYLYGTPTKTELQQLWDVWTEGMLGFILIVRGDDPDSLEEAATYLDHFNERGDWPFLVAVNIGGEDEEPDLEDVANYLEVDFPDQLLEVDAKSRDSVKEVLLNFLALAISPKRARALARSTSSTI